VFLLSDDFAEKKQGTFDLFANTLKILCASLLDFSKDIVVKQD